MPENNCENCKLKARYDSDPRSFLGRLWKFHIKFCPGWKAYLVSLPEDKREELFQKYGRRNLG
jgi:hypothetical protein